MQSMLRVLWGALLTGLLRGSTPVLRKVGSCKVAITNGVGQLQIILVRSRVNLFHPLEIVTQVTRSFGECIDLELWSNSGLFIMGIICE